MVGWYLQERLPGKPKHRKTKRPREHGARPEKSGGVWEGLLPELARSVQEVHFKAHRFKYCRGSEVTVTSGYRRRRERRTVSEPPSRANPPIARLGSTSGVVFGEPGSGGGGYGCQCVPWAWAVAESPSTRARVANFKRFFMVLSFLRAVESRQQNNAKPRYTFVKPFAALNHNCRGRNDVVQDAEMTASCVDRG